VGETMSNINNVSVISQQYKDDKNLSIRIALHQKYSTNKYGYTNWIFDLFKIYDGCNVLELGCGNGIMWSNRIQSLPVGSKLILSDISNGMIEIVREKFKDYPNVSTEIIDIQDIMYPDNSFDIIIANSMLYHVPNLQKAISEVYRVLKPGGKFYATTTGVNGMTKYLYERFKEFNPNINAFSKPFPFNLQNGKDILSRNFANIEIYEYEDSLEITETSDLIDWILSSTLTSRIDQNELIGLDVFFEKCKDTKGIIKIPKQAGMFVSIK
jgi:ubiquinone/menaquinone biosynthesis C-methylase UbiE